MCANIVVRSRAHGFSPTLLRAFARVLLPRRPGAAEAFLGPRRAAREVRDDGLGGLRGAGRHGGREAIQRRALQGHRRPLPAPVLQRGFRGRRHGGLHGQAARFRALSLALLVKLTFAARGRRALTCSHDRYDIFQSIQELVAPRAPFLLRVLACIASHCLAASVERAGGARAFKIGGSEVTVSSSCVGSHCITLLGRFGGALRRRERQARSDVLSLWVTYLPQRSSRWL